MLTLITGGARSGKSRHALELAQPFSERAFIATAQAFDNEMGRRIEAHQQERADTFITVEEPLEPASALDSFALTTEVVVLDCLTLWLGNLVYRAEQEGRAWPSRPDDEGSISRFLRRLDGDLPFHLIVVSNELGMGLVPPEPMGRAFRDLAGWVNQEVARRADRVLLMVSGLPLEIPVSGSSRL